MSTLSFWEREEILRSDVIVIGAGIIGLSTAVSIRELQPGISVTVLEREILPSGASTKNAGFACFGSITEMIHDLATKGESATLAIVEQRRRGLNVLRSRLGDEAMGYEDCGGCELLVDDNASAVERLGEINTLMQPIFGETYFEQRDDLIVEYGFDPTRVPHLIRMKREGGLNAGLMMRNLATFAAERGVRVITGADVRECVEESGGVRVSVNRHVLQDVVEFRAEQVVVCTNALAPYLLPALEIIPGRGQVLITHPISSLKFNGIFHFDAGFYYFRNIGNRVLMGGGRNIDFGGEATDVFATTELIQSALEGYLRDMILPGVEFVVDMRWAGIMGFNSSGFPVVEKFSDRIIVAFGCNGMGIALGSSIGARAAEIVVG